MLYNSTRGGADGLPAAEVIKMGIAPDGGLFVPGEMPRLSLEQLQAMSPLSYQERAKVVLRLFLTDYSAAEIDDCVSGAYNAASFDHPDVAPLRRLGDRLFVQELWHGPTSAFKDMALQILPHFLTQAAQKTGDPATIVILVATSGDTGKAALEGFKDVPKTRIVVFYPEDGVSRIQKLQMATQEGANVDVVAVRGNFDDAQNGVKEIFANTGFGQELARGDLLLSSANSINWGRVAPQIIYYFSAYLDLLAQGVLAAGEPINIVVPTGNFGNILSAYYAREMGVPVNKLICAANSNNVLTDFIRTGIYDRNRRFWKTISPSMDILISSNLERLLYHLNGNDAGRIRAWMAALKETGRFQVDELTFKAIGALFWSGFASDAATMETIAKTYRENHYLLDPHTGAGLNVYEQYQAANGAADQTVTVLASTASPYKFNASVAEAILGQEKIQGQDELALLDTLFQLSGMEIPPGLRNLGEKPIRHRRTAAKENLLPELKDILIEK